MERQVRGGSLHGYGVLWTPKELIFEIDGEPVAAVVNNSAVHGPADIAFSSTLIYAGVPEHPEGHDNGRESVTHLCPPVAGPQPSRIYRVRTARS
jgi:hypothetical protein